MYKNLHLQTLSLSVWLTIPLKKITLNQIKDSTWRETFLLVIPAMFVLVVPRILSMSLIVAYTKAFAIFFILALIFFNIVMNIPHLKKYPVQVLLGTMTNVFAPCIVIDEGSRFYKWSGTIASSIHALSLIVLNCLVIGGAFIPCPDLLKKSYPPVLHCYPGIYRFHSCTYSFYSACT